jgi:hypothetical protein
MRLVGQALPADAVRAQIRADLELIDGAFARLRATRTDLVGNAFRVEAVERLETLDRVNRALSYRMFGEIADPADGPGDLALPVDVGMRNLLCSRLRITSAEVKRRLRWSARICPRRSLTGPTLPPELPELAAAAEEGAVGDDHIASVFRALDVLPSAVRPVDRDKAERTLVRHATRQDAKFVAAVGDRIADCLNPDGNFSDEDRAKRRGLVLGSQGLDGMSRLSGWLDPEARAYLETVTAAIRPGRHLPETSPPTAAERDTRTSAQRCHDGLKLALRQAISSGQLGVHRGVPVAVIARTTLAELDQAVRAAQDSSIPMPAPARTGGNSRLPMRDLIRMASGSILPCSRIIPIVRCIWVAASASRRWTNAWCAMHAMVAAPGRIALNPATIARSTTRWTGRAAVKPTPTASTSPVRLIIPRPRAVTSPRR